MARAADNGMDVFRVFDALNDVRNVKRAIAAVKKAGKHAQGTICYTVSPLAHGRRLREQARQLDGPGLRLALHQGYGRAAEAPASLRHREGDQGRTWRQSVRVHVHVHATTGVTLVSLMKAIEAGADVVDTAISSLSLGPATIPTESLVHMLDGTGYTTKLDMARLLKIRDHFATIRPRYTEFLSNITGVDTEIFDSQIPGGMISNMESQLKQQGAADKVREVLLEVPEVRKTAGYPPLVTPSSQIVGTQAVFNVLMGHIQSDHRGVCGPDARLLRFHARRARS